MGRGAWNWGRKRLSGTRRRARHLRAKGEGTLTTRTNTQAKKTARNPIKEVSTEVTEEETGPRKVMPLHTGENNAEHGGGRCHCGREKSQVKSKDRILPGPGKG